MVRVLVASLLVLAQAAQAQIALPPVRLPGLPAVGLPVDVDKTLPAVTGALDPGRLQDLRKLRALDLIRRHPTVIEPDPNGAPIIRSEVLVFSPSEALLDNARAAGFTVAREQVLEGLDERIVVLRAPGHTSTRRALQRLRALDPAGAYDFNHVYMESGTGSSAAVAGAAPEGGDPDAGGGAGARARLGLIDGGVDTAHPVLRDSVIHQHGCSGSQTPGAHGTAVASLLVGRSARFHG